MRIQALLCLAAALGLSAEFSAAQSADDMKQELDRAFDGRIGMPQPMREEFARTGRIVIPKPVVVRLPPGNLVDLHVHLFMEKGLGILFQGEFNGPLRSDDWSDRFSSQANPATLNASSLGLVIASLYAHPVFAPDRKGSIRAQIAEARAFVASNPDWYLATSAPQAAAAHQAGKKVLVLSLEGASGILDSEEDLREFIDNGGIRIVTFAHLADDKMTGAAMMGGYQNLGNPRGLIAALPNKRGEYGELLNPHGLTPRGRQMVRALLARGVWIDLSHSPDSAQADLIPMLEAAGQPLLFTHGALRSWRHAERGMSDAQLDEVRATGGIVGLCPAPLGNTGDVSDFAREFNDAARKVGASHVFVGSDFNGAQNHLKPNRFPTGSSLDEHGLHQIGQTAELWSDMRDAGADANQSSFHGVENFVQIWSRVRPVVVP
jgi:microsomal dipeptidase-like Zn-dependent dipeptidase